MLLSVDKLWLDNGEGSPAVWEGAEHHVPSAPRTSSSYCSSLLYGPYSSAAKRIAEGTDEAGRAIRA